MALSTLVATETTSTVASQLRGWDHLEWWVGNARAVTAWLTSGFGFEVIAYAGPETGIADRVSYVLAQGEVETEPMSKLPSFSSETVMFAPAAEISLLREVASAEREEVTRHSGI